MKTSQSIKKYVINFAHAKAKQQPAKEKRKTFFELAKLSISKNKTGVVHNASGEVDKLVYGID